MNETELLRYWSLVEENLESAINYRQSLIPNSLFKFISLSDNDEENEKKFSTLTNGCVWFTKSTKLNDPFDIQAVNIDLVKIKETEDLSDTDIEELDNCIKEERESAYILSLSEKSYRSIIMWAHYANNHRGFCIEYSVVRRDRLFDVNYIPERYKVAKTFLNSCGDEISCKKARVSKAIMLEQYLSKQKDWEYEKEYRAVDFTKCRNDGYEKNANDIGLKIEKIIAGWQCESKSKQILKCIADKLGCAFMIVAPSDAKYEMVEYDGEN